MTEREGAGEGAAPPPRRDFEEAYAGTPPWDIGHPQPAFLELAERGLLTGSVLDAGCGTGEHALMAAALGLETTGIDSARAAIAKAKQKAQDRGLPLRFFVWDALDLASLGEDFDTVLDCGLFHVFDDESRARYVESLSGVTRAGGHYHLLCFSDRQPGEGRPRRVTQGEIQTSFASGWRVESIVAAKLEITAEPGYALAWQAVIARL